MDHRAFWDAADKIVRSTRLPHERGYDRDRAAIAEQVREVREFKRAADRHH